MSKHLCEYLGKQLFVTHKGERSNLPCIGFDESEGTVTVIKEDGALLRLRMNSENPVLKRQIEFSVALAKALRGYFHMPTA